ncbi:hypothetical protein ACOME3_002641 [Neoechinorhynchus agilis]
MTNPEEPLARKAGHMRQVVAILAMLGMFMQYCQKIDLSVNLVCMVDTKSKVTKMTERANRSMQLCPELGTSSKTKTAKKDLFKRETFDWSPTIRSHLLIVYGAKSTLSHGRFQPYGYLISEIPAGILSSKYGPKWVMTGALLTNCLCNLLYASAARIHYGLLIFLRVVVGTGCGCLFPAVSQIWSKWAPTPERSFLVSLATSGAHLGTIMTLPLGGFLCTTKWGWPGLFYTIAILGFVWTFAWIIIFSDTPEKNKFTGNAEKLYIARFTGGAGGDDHSNVPWKSIFTSKHCWGMFSCHTCMNWGFYTLLTQTPTYMKEELLFDIKKNGLLSSLPYLSVWIVICVSSYSADLLLSKNLVKSRTLLRKVAVLIGSIIPAICLFALGFVNCQNKFLAVALLTIGQGLYGVAWGAGFMVNANDLAPPIAGIVFGISNTLATIPGIIVPHVAGFLTKEGNGLDVAWQWRTVFIISSVIWVIGGLLFLILGSGDVEPWIRHGHEKSENDDELVDSPISLDVVKGEDSV